MAIALKEILEKRRKLVQEGRDIVDRSEKEGRSALNAEEQASFDKIMNDVEECRKTIENVQRISDAEKLLNDVVVSETDKSKRENTSKVTIRSANEAIDTPEYRSAFQKYLVNGRDANFNSDEQRALIQGSGPEGGFLVPAEQVVNTLIKFVDDAVYIRQKATKFQLQKAVSLGIPSWDADPADAEWTSEVGTGSTDTSMRVGKRELLPNPLAKRIKISLSLLRNSPLPIDTYALQRLAYKFAVTEEKHFLTGHGASQPLGMLTPSANGISTGRDVVGENTSTEMTFNGLKDAKYFLKPQYWNSAEWFFHRFAVSHLAKIKDGEGRYVWEESTKIGDPDTLLNFPVRMSEFMPYAFTSSSYVGLLGDYSFYHIADSLALTIQRLNELYAESNQVGFIGRLETDGMPVLEEAFVRVKLNS